MWHGLHLVGVRTMNSQSSAVRAWKSPLKGGEAVNCGPAVHAETVGGSRQHDYNRS